MTDVEALERRVTELEAHVLRLSAMVADLALTVELP